MDDFILSLGRLRGLNYGNAVFFVRKWYLDLNCQQFLNPSLDDVTAVEFVRRFEEFAANGLIRLLGWET